MRDGRYDALRVFSCVAVILLHVSARPLYLHIGGGASHYWWLVGGAISALTHWCVPVFVMLSGALILSKNASWQETYSRRIPRIAIVLIFSITIYGFWRRYFIGDFSASAFWNDVLKGQPYYHLYFFYVVIGLYAVSPVASAVVQEVSARTLKGIAVAGCIVSFLLPTFGLWRGTYLRDAVSFPWDYLGYFLLGAYLVKYRPKARYGAIVVISYLTSLAWIESASWAFCPGSTWAMYSFMYFSPFVCALSIGIFGLIIIDDIKLDNVIFSKLAPLTLIVYIIHPMVMETIRYIYATRLPLLNRLVFDLPLTFCATVLISFCVAWVAHRSPLVRRTF